MHLNSYYVLLIVTSPFPATIFSLCFIYRLHHSSIQLHCSFCLLHPHCFLSVFLLLWHCCIPLISSLYTASFILLPPFCFIILTSILICSSSILLYSFYLLLPYCLIALSSFFHSAPFPLTASFYISSSISSTCSSILNASFLLPLSNFQLDYIYV